MVWKVTEAGLMAVLIASGLTFGSTLVLEYDKLRRGRKAVGKASWRDEALYHLCQPTRVK